MARQKFYFTTQKQHLLRAYADLLSLAFWDHEFYDKSAIALVKMPGMAEQEEDYRLFEARKGEIINATGKSLEEADVFVRQEMERKYMRLMTERIIVQDGHFDYTEKR